MPVPSQKKGKCVNPCPFFAILSVDLRQEYSIACHGRSSDLSHLLRLPNNEVSGLDAINMQSQRTYSSRYCSGFTPDSR